MIPGFAEAPKEALPHDCRPGFGVALLTRHKFKVNESYNCWYSFGMSNIEIFRDINFGCHVKGPSGIEMIRRYFILSTRFSKFWLASRQLPAGVGWGMAAGTAVGFFAPLILLILSKYLAHSPQSYNKEHILEVIEECLQYLQPISELELNLHTT